MSWGTELWDQYETISLHTQKGIDFLEKYGHFIRDRCAIEMEYAGKLRRLVKNYQPKKKDEEDYQYSPCRAFKHVMTEINDLAGQHEVIAENLQSNVIREVSILVKDFKEERKKHLQEGARMMANLSAQINSLDRARKNYEKAFKEAERALDNFQRADADLNLSRAEVEKQRMNMTIKSQQCEETKNEYANQLQKTNDLQNQHYHTMMPDVFHQLQELDEKRIKNIKNFMIQSVDIERNVFPIISKCLDGIVRASEQINEKEDTLMVIERYKSGFQPPEDFPFEDLSAIKSGEVPAPINTVAITSIRPEAMTIKGTMSAGKIKKRVGIFGIFSSNKFIEVCIAFKNNFSSYGENKEDYSDLPPNQRKKKLQLRVEDIMAKIQQETAARDGLMKMKGVYEQNPALGDPMSIEGQLNESGHKLDKLRLELQKYQGYLEEAIEGINNKSGQQSVVLSVSPSAPSRRNKGTAPGHHLNGGHLHRHHRNSGGSGGEEDSLSRSASDSSVSNPTVNHKQSAPGTPLPSHGPESGLGTSHTSLPDSDPEHGDSDAQGHPGSDYCDGEVLPALGICKALYPFEATSEGSIPMQDGEELHIIELDQGDGWTRVRRQIDMEEGFVPTSYIECTLFNSC
ncbi:formin-binding protein 1-like isoform X2 [Zootermopsis nevadensis]|uniref:formin-binding protein 1-like isoform X2 n=1 Tax=Zootermopsis nevadensis TaxID=136037 RepID=UPI000B8EE0D5|nr:formin-binding protein 1-like isoform X2 [Zootermopsis nevadensis]